MEKGSFGLLHEAQAVGDDGKKTFGSGQIDKLKNGTMYNNSSTNVSIYRLAVTQKLCTTKAFFFKAKPRHFEALDSLYEILVLGQLRGRVSSKLSFSVTQHSWQLQQKTDGQITKPTSTFPQTTSYEC